MCSIPNTEWKIRNSSLLATVNYLPHSRHVLKYDTVVITTNSHIHTIYNKHQLNGTVIPFEYYTLYKQCSNGHYSCCSNVGVSCQCTVKQGKGSEDWFHTTTMNELYAYGLTVMAYITDCMMHVEHHHHSVSCLYAEKWRYKGTWNKVGWGEESGKTCDAILSNAWWFLPPVHLHTQWPVVF